MLRLRADNNEIISYTAPIKTRSGKSNEERLCGESMHVPDAKRARFEESCTDTESPNTQRSLPALATSAASSLPFLPIHHNTKTVGTINRQLTALRPNAEASPTDISHRDGGGVSSLSSSTDRPSSPTSALLAATSTNMRENTVPPPSPSSPRPRIRQHELHAADFQHEEVLGEGSYSLVSLATHRASGLLFALKEIDRARLRCLQLEPQLRWEINLQRTLRHPNIVRLYSYFITSSCIILVLEYCRGGTLLHRVKTAPLGRLAERQASRYTRHVAKALAHLHALGVAHRDLKLENVLVDEDGIAKLADFGWSRPVGSSVVHQGSAGVTEELYSAERDEAKQQTTDERQAAQRGISGVQQSGDANTREDGEVEGRRTVCGTLDYLSPEMVSGQTHSYKTDVWSLGVMLAEMLTGVPPFYKDSTQQTLRAIRCESPNLCGASPSRDRNDQLVLSAGALSLIEAMLQKDPARRPTMREVLAHPWLQKTMWSAR
ncbi:putative serine/threonine-protein kinase putativeprotein kinase [Leptomonas pyrrhocoris]|uniref:Putative serine/threonine-protein kinase putativeprotein kinase n=1 Tax=Leptomonas pyrrhocoris TaxID=157538 RepID=A0A0M9G1L4_LEPPY|nr:putative serine/threonine-protein kinase putativeprotein kinase [Leptomonas pyrrhocoris]KPA80495.1 putative serine/threonine-protein kinase putativeprotein kinase [Leptomonas pyrrhocoris]|eukprot:XP_015658934.1 putative serine/threonine-protein kinase putativeprotein kinase [Leptomonas pyrrhocoris]